MDRIIVVTTTHASTADQLNTLRKRVIEQLPATGYVVLVVPNHVEVHELGTRQQPERHGQAEVEQMLGEPGTAPAAPDTTTSPSGSKVEHVSAEVFDEPIRYVWLSREETTDDQRAMAVGVDTMRVPPRWAISLDQLTPDQVLFARPICEL